MITSVLHPESQIFGEAITCRTHSRRGAERTHDAVMLLKQPDPDRYGQRCRRECDVDEPE